MISNSICIRKQSLYKTKKLIFYSEIFLTIKGKDTQKILNNDLISLYYSSQKTVQYQFDTLPSEILINGEKTNSIGFYVYNLSLEENNITIRFNQSLTNCYVMFCGLSNIIYINFNKFDSSQVMNMAGMFRGCSNLISLKISNLNTSSVTDISGMFNGCSKLISLDLRSFNTSSVIYMGYMFYKCNNLISLDLSTFNTLSVTNMEGMFYGCSSLISLDLNNFETSSSTNMNYLFTNCKSNLIYCINNETSNTQKIRNTIQDYSFKNNNNCSDICFEKDKKIIYSQKKCAVNCSDTDIFNYNNICYETCPNGTHNIYNNICIENDYNIINYDISSNIIDNNGYITNITNIINNTYLYNAYSSFQFNINSEFLDNSVIMTSYITNDSIFL